MKIFRRISGKVVTASEKSYVEDLFKEPFEFGYFSKDLEEDSMVYKAIRDFAESKLWSDTVIGTTFEDKEILSAEVLLFNGPKAFAYPEPQESKYGENTYNDYCYECGIYGLQKADFEIKANTNLKNVRLGSLHWVFDELFSAKSLYNSFFEPLGFMEREVKLYKKNIVSQEIVQVVTPELGHDLDLKEIEHSICASCSRLKYLPTINGYFPLPKSIDFQIAKTREFFGSGHSASKKILVKNDIMQRMISNKLAKAHQFAPCR